MTDEQHRQLRQQFSSRIRLQVAGEDDVYERFAANLSDGGLFVQHDTPPPPGATVLLEFVLPDGTPLCRAAGKVVHARPAIVPGEKTAGMGLEFVQLDPAAKALVVSFREKTRRPPAPSSKSAEQGLSLGDAHRATGLLSMSGPVVGIDLGTVNSCVAYVKDGQPYVITSPQGYEIIPSVVFVGPSNMLVGHKAVEKLILQPSKAIYGSKRFLGRPFASKEVRSLGHFFNYNLVPGDDGATAAEVDGKVIDLRRVAAHILAAIRDMAVKHLGREDVRAVITVPAYFGETQRQAVRSAGRAAGLYVERLISEPTAAAVAYGYGRGLQRTILVYDLGGGTFDVSLLRINDDTLEVLATDGDPFLGGADFDDRLTEYVLMSYARQHGHELRDDPVAVQRIRFAVELAKRQLSDAQRAELDLPYVRQTPEGSVDLRMVLERSTLEAITQDLVDRTLKIVDGVLKTADLRAEELDDVILVGGQSRSPHVRRVLVERFGRKPSSSIHPDQAVALGAAIVGDIMHSKKPIKLTDILPASIRLGRPDGFSVVLLPRGTRLPATRRFHVEGEGEKTRGHLILCRGEAQKTSDNTLLGALHLPPDVFEELKRDKLTLTMVVSADGLLSVTTALGDGDGKPRELDISLVAESIAP